MYTPVRRKDLFNGSWFEISEIVDKGISHGIALGGISETLAKDFQEMIRDRNVQTKFLTDDDENHQQVIANEQAERILRDPGQRKLVFSGTNQKSERRRPFGTGLVRHCPQGLFSPFFTFLLCHIFPPV